MIENYILFLLSGICIGLFIAYFLIKRNISYKAKTGQRLSVKNKLYKINEETESTLYSDRIKTRLGPSRIKSCPYCGSTHPELSQHLITCYLRIYSETITGEKIHDIDELLKAWSIRFVASFKGEYNRDVENKIKDLKTTDGVIAKRVVVLKKEKNEYFVYLRISGYYVLPDCITKGPNFQNTLPLFYIPEEDNEYICFLFSSMGYDIDISGGPLFEAPISTGKSTKEGKR